jgi:8-oxo-dGTP pyrophosphatase MutT (NUDIX family)
MKAFSKKHIKATVASIFLLKTDGSALFQHRDNYSHIKHPGMWGLPGGQREVRESLEACVIRELFEETGYKTKSVFYINTYVDNSAKGWPEYSCAFFLVFF